MLKVMHVLNRYGQNGISAGLINLVKDGFYDPFNLRVVALAKGEAKTDTYDTLSHYLGTDHVSFLRPDSKPDISKDFLSLRAQLREQLDLFQPDAIICSNTASLLILRSLALFDNRLRLISFMHATSCEGAFMRAALKATSFRDDAVFGDAAITLNEIIPQIFMARPETYIVPLVIPEIASPKPAQHVSHFRITSLGRLHPEKNYTELVKALALLKKEGRSFHLTIGGEGGQRTELAEMVKNLGLQNEISLPGYQDKKTLLKATDIYVQPSLQEGLCLSFLEAMGSGVAVVGSNVGGMQEYGQDNFNMYKIDGFNGPAIATALRRAMDNFADRGAEISRNAVVTTEKYFGKTAVREQWAAAQDAVAHVARRNPKQSTGGRLFQSRL